MDLALKLRAGIGLGLCALGASLSLTTGQGPGSRNAPFEGIAQAAQQHTPGSPYVLTPERKALLNTIRYAEGTWKNGSSMGYRILYGGGTFSNLQRHPEKAVVKRYTSAAAGAYQFLPKTWSMAADRLELPDFGPSSQDQAALFLIDRRNALEEADAGKLTPELVAKLAPEWASLPTLQDQSFYGQPVRDIDELIGFYEDNLEELRRQASNSGPQNLRLG
jgi:lysozyme